MRTRRLAWISCSSFVLLLSTCSLSYAQYTANIQGVVADPSGAAVPNATLEAVNLATQVSATATSDDAGNYRFLSLAPGTYKLTAEAKGFRKAEVTVILQTNQTLNVPIPLEVGLAEQVTVTGATPLVNTAETRNQMTLQTDSRQGTINVLGHPQSYSVQFYVDDGRKVDPPAGLATTAQPLQILRLDRPLHVISSLSFFTPWYTFARAASSEIPSASATSA